MNTTRTFRRVLFAGLLGCVAAWQANATVIVTSATRHVRADVSGLTDLVTSPATSGPFIESATVDAFPDDAFATASQSTTIGTLPLPLVFSGSGSALIMGSTDSLVLQSTSSFFVEFTLDVSHAFSLSATLLSDFNFDEGMADANVNLLGGENNFSLVRSTVLGDSVVNEAGTLAKGSYFLGLAAHANNFDHTDPQYSANSSYEFNLTLRELTSTQVPEPLTLALLGSGLLGMALMRRRQK